MQKKYGNNQHPTPLGRLPDNFYLIDGVPYINNMILPSQETIDKFLSPVVHSKTYEGIKMLLSDIKKAAQFIITEGFLSPFPTLPEIESQDLRDVIDFIIGYQGGGENIFLDQQIFEIQDFLRVSGSQIYPEFVDDGNGIKIHCYRNAVHYNQLNYCFDALDLFFQMTER